MIERFQEEVREIKEGNGGEKQGENGDMEERIGEKSMGEKMRR